MNACGTIEVNRLYENTAVMNVVNYWNLMKMEFIIVRNLSWIWA